VITPNSSRVFYKSPSKVTFFNASTPTKQPNISYNLKPSVKKTFHSKTTMKNKTNKQTQQETKTFEPYKKNHSLRKNKVLTATAN
jgi:hypothetical protein